MSRSLVRFSYSDLYSWSYLLFVGFEITAVHSNLKHQQILSNCRKLLHYSMEELFYPRVAMTIQSTSKGGNSSPSTALKSAVQFLAWTAPAVLSLVLFFFVLSLSTELRQMKSSLESCSSMVEAGWDQPDPVTFTVTSTFFAPAPPSSTPTSTTSAKWWFSSDHPAATPSPPPAQPPQEASNHHASPVHEIPHDVPSTPRMIIPTISPTPMTTPHSDTLMPLSDLLHWTLHFDFDFPPAHVAAEKARHGLIILWEVVRKVYHYPLDPP